MSKKPARFNPYAEACTRDSASEIAASIRMLQIEMAGTPIHDAVQHLEDRIILGLVQALSLQKIIVHDLHSKRISPKAVRLIDTIRGYFYGLFNPLEIDRLAGVLEEIALEGEE